MTKAMALRRSGLTSTEVTVIEAPRSSGSRISPRSISCGQQVPHFLADAELALAGAAAFSRSEEDEA